MNLEYGGLNRSMSKALEEAKREYAENEAEDAWEDWKFINQVLYDYFYDKVKGLDKEDFIEYLEDLEWDKESITECFFKKTA